MKWIFCHQRLYFLAGEREGSLSPIGIRENRRPAESVPKNTLFHI